MNIKSSYELRKKRFEKTKTDYGIKPLPLKGFEHYFVTRDGRVFNTLNPHGNILDKPVEVKTHLNKSIGYKQTTLQNKKLGLKPKTVYVHRLVAETYLNKPSENHNEVNHKNLNKTDNRLENLEWVTRSENRKHLLDTLGSAGGNNHGVRYHLDINPNLLRIGIKVYGITQCAKDVADIWDCSENFALELLKENGCEAFGKHKLPKMQKDALLDDMKNQIQSQRKSGAKIILTKEFIKGVEDKYQTKFSRWYLDKIKIEAINDIDNNPIQNINTFF